ncbi:DDE-type integrase/transposase/recombinase [Halostreptopolyspora alba]|uniref:Integrase catalytic domain-containing protein n=1 Tax=Halostreptopolyspora alba TaxID=2487137 RepID=A0A3N0E8P8_9ACTN|nr:hypothetical protein EFW17_13370 [Nocardiopsaceae bacterium YIM 96095]
MRARIMAIHAADRACGAPRITAEAPNMGYVGDITHLPVAGSLFVYLVTVTDLYSRRVAGWSWPSTCAPNWSATRWRRPGARSGLDGVLHRFRPRRHTLPGSSRRCARSQG